MARTGREWSRGEWVVAAAFLAGLLGLLAPTPAAAEGDKPSPPPTIFELTKPQVPSALKGMSDSVREGILMPPPPPVQEWVLQPDGSMKNTRTGMSIALRNVCAPGDMEHEAALAAFKRSQARKNH
jgi:hypothetical protein